MRNLLLYGLIYLFSCSQSSDKKTENSQQLFQLVSPEETGIDFTNSIQNERDFNIFSYRNFYNGGGVSIGDINNDGLVDVYMTSNRVKQTLFK
ncbi:MAG: hypothetical protein R2769_03460 [Saprospiraceae bacterium]